MSKEPKSPKGEKADGSQKYWDKYFDLDMGFEAVLPETHKATYDKLVSLEAKIDILSDKYWILETSIQQAAFDRGIEMLKAEYEQILKEHNL